ncbi:5-methylaminomethyl-2-thiouridylate-methyltransferase [Wallemia mellicola]|uniref:tRNA-5-taurinomethyluridine 2-sulfurtransferase n=1 Tax=Wallemia mellicola TaxID=1708541 RepID=A0A4T0M0C2_9BASI|nr:hypothetical protein E3Q24_01166 [Wallemia mellicola]TIB75897.1 hypothetical protein E3Q23_02113 [Wallemia mellicola]TIB80976.1 5-methylaminomethyl-2-thiouridylate-methyltransferase [Wallemia mellicola]TIB87984.1 5-methylaminomethyl-2-thiouridylate-methyltransferase [Wallemia mellicola]TIB90794.1 5-methylaminomethyl-2-thiouridylate-methyltransferase [Wallemia mellicola]
MFGRALSANRRVVVGMSGGVDSAVAAGILGLDVRAVFMRNWDTKDELSLSTVGGVKGCEWERDWEDVKRVCHHLNIKDLKLVDLSKQYWYDVFEPSLDVWRDGRTPNPDIGCNKHIKFGALLDLVLKNDDMLATGHYARILNNHLYRGRDRLKDQSYYLSAIQRSVLDRVVFPLGTLEKSHVRSLARELRLPNAEREESMGICFVGERGNRFGAWLDDYVDNVPGYFLTEDNKPIGKHRGVHHYTIGQKAGIGGMPSKMFVAAKRDTDIIVVNNSQHDLLKCKKIFTLGDTNWLADIPAKSFEAHAQVRHRQQETRCTVEVVDNKLEITYQEYEMAVAPGQVVAIYIGDICVASATIDKTQSIID